MTPVPEPDPTPAGDLATVDEILQVMYWLRGEGLASAVTAADLARWVVVGAGRVAPVLVRMADTGLVRPAGSAADGAPRYELTAAGVREGARRFADEFAGLTRPGHGECADPDCECRHSGNPADCVHRHVEGPTP
jgi:hypothetical protein